MTAPINNACDVFLNQNPGTLPSPIGAMLDYFQQMTYTVITKQTVNFQVVETRNSIDFIGVRQPFTSRQLMMKPEGERSWSWEKIHALPNIQLEPDDIIYFESVPYRVMQKWDWTKYGYVELDLVQDYTE